MSAPVYGPHLKAAQMSEATDQCAKYYYAKYAFMDQCVKKVNPIANAGWTMSVASTILGGFGLLALRSSTLLEVDGRAVAKRAFKGYAGVVLGTAACTAADEYLRQRLAHYGKGHEEWQKAHDKSAYEDTRLFWQLGQMYPVPLSVYGANLPKELTQSS